MIGRSLPNSAKRLRSRPEKRFSVRNRPQRYALRTVTAPEQWNDTFVLLYGNKTGLAAYHEAIDQTHFGTIYLTLDTVNGRKINEYLTNSETPYRLSEKVPFYRHGQIAGYYLVWTPKVLGR